eukprot:CAMPEP_0118880170 /NCGR_PEP_ID=MMETSP1163-20130328/19777_1 /TAXON_ID=124430 /ORGANISM="Phaeomonas parva, Strain CCMP2877" /LENGTH=149 /DNA_ID=CAMNT_0006816491 /DNA_START=67 /DNA_END=513 /DNA_ORIENTATION=-
MSGFQGDKPKRKPKPSEMFAAVTARFDNEEDPEGREHYRVAATKAQDANSAATAKRIEERTAAARNAGGNSGGRKRRINAKVAEILTRQKASGSRPALKEDERFYLNVRLWRGGDGDDEAPVLLQRFFPRVWTLGRAEQDVVAHLRTFG